VIAIDTNVLLRHLLDDDKAQAKKAHALIRSGENVLVTDVVLAETIWTLKGKKYKASRDDIVTVINSLFAEPYIIFENPQVVWAALNDYRKAKPVKVSGKNNVADFPDALIINKARYTASQTGDVLDAVYTFDRAALEINGAKAP
jgi:predicted nucleic-acid-binding protein